MYIPNFIRRLLLKPKEHKCQWEQTSRWKEGIYTYTFYKCTQPGCTKIAKSITTVPHSILGLDISATAAEIKAAYRKLTLLHHPDRGGKPETFLKVKQAYDQLTKP